MDVVILDRCVGRYSCELGEFEDFPADPMDRPACFPLPRIAAFSDWFEYNSTVRRREVGGVEYVDVDHQDRVWTYRLEPAWTTVPSERGFFQFPHPFDVGIMPD